MTQIFIKMIPTTTITKFYQIIFSSHIVLYIFLIISFCTLTITESIVDQPPAPPLTTESNYQHHQRLSATIQIICLIHPYNKLIYLPHLFGWIEQQHYPKDRLRLHFLTERIFYDESIFMSGLDETLYADVGTSETDEERRYELLDDRIRNNDRTIEALRRWTRHNREQYNDIELTISNTPLNEKLFGIEPQTSSSGYWSKERFKLLIDTKNQALTQAYQSWADFILLLDADVILIDSFTLRNLTEIFDQRTDALVAAPMLYSSGTYSNFWAGMDKDGYYIRTDDYLPILERKSVGLFEVPMVHTCVMIDARKSVSRLLSFDPLDVVSGDTNAQTSSSTSPPIPYDDIIAFAKSVATTGASMIIDNRHVRGYIPPPISNNDQSVNEKQTLVDLELESLVEGPPFPVSPSLESFHDPLVDKPDRLGVDQIYVINLRRRPERRQRMIQSLALLGIDARIWDATDGKRLSAEYLRQNHIESLDGYLDPYHKRPITFGEIGCFLSHFRVWEHAWRENYSTIVILEDDVRFERNFRQKFSTTLEHFQALQQATTDVDDDQFDFLYLGRKLNGDPNEEKPALESIPQLVRPGYSYWTIGYMLTRAGIAKLLHSNPLRRLLPVDEFLPILYGAHPNTTLAAQFGADRMPMLKALAPRYLLVYPTHYVGDDAYVSDTEDSDKVSDKNTAAAIVTEDFDEIEKSNHLSSNSNNDHSSSSSILRPPPMSSSSYHVAASSSSYQNGHLEL